MTGAACNFVRKLEIGNSVLVQIKITIVVPEPGNLHPWWRKNDIGLGGLRQGQYPNSGCACREGVHVEVFATAK